MKNSILLLAALLLYCAAGAQKIVTGNVTDATGKTPLKGATVKIQGIQVTALTDAGGRFKITGLTTGTYKLLCAYAGYQDNTRSITVGKADTLYVQIKMQPARQEQPEAITGGKKDEKSVAPAAAEYYSLNGLKGQKSYNMTYNWKAPDVMSIPDWDNMPMDTVGNNIFRNVTKNPFSTFSIDVDDGSYSLMRKTVNAGSLPAAAEVRTEEFINYFNYSYPLPKTTEIPFSVYTEMSNCPWNPANKLLHLGIQGYDVQKAELPPSNLVFLIDVSGSMGTYDKLPLIKKAFNYLIDELTEKDKISIVVYAGSSGLVLPPTPGNEKTKIKEAINKLESGGSTAGGAGIELAYKTAKENFIKNGNNRVILATDGDFNVGVSDDAGLVQLIEQKREDGIFLSVVGCGTGNYQDKKMEQLADHGNGYYGYVDDEAEAKRIFAKQMGATILTIAKDVKLQVEFNPAWVKEYKLIGYENRQLEDHDFANDKKDAGELGAGSSVTALYEIVLYDAPKENRAIEQKNKDLTYAAFGANDMVALNIRYKDPKENKSKLITQMIGKDAKTLSATSDDFRFSAAVAMCGMLLKNAVNKGNSTFDMAYSLASASIGADGDGYRKEFTELLKKMKSLEGSASAK